MIARDANANTGQSSPSTSPTTLALTVSGTNRFLVVGVYTRADVVTGVTYAGVAMTQGAKKIVPDENTYTYVYYLVTPTTGNNNVVVSYTGTGEMDVIASSYTGVAQTGQPDATATASGTSTTLTGSITTVADNCWVVWHGRHQSGGPIAAGTNSTLIAAYSWFGAMFDNKDNGSVTPAGSFNMQGTVNPSNGWAMAMISFSPAAAEAPATRRRIINF